MAENTDNVFIRDLSLGLVRGLEGKVSWINRRSTSNQTVSVPVYVSMTAGTRFLMDAFVDDVPGARVELNTDQKQRIIVTPTSWAIKSTELANPNTWVKLTEYDSDEVRQYYAKLKLVPVRVSYGIKARLPTALDLLRMWQEIIEHFFLYRYFDFTYNGVRCEAVFVIPDDNDSKIPVEQQLDANSDSELNMNFEVHTVMPLFDQELRTPANKGVQWYNKIHDAPSPPKD